MEALGIGGSIPYDLRHSFASLLIQAGVSVVEVARQMGNAPSVTLHTYGHVFDEFRVREEYAESEAEGQPPPNPHQITKPSIRLELMTPSLPSRVFACCEESANLV